MRDDSPVILLYNFLQPGNKLVPVPRSNTVAACGINPSRTLFRVSKQKKNHIISRIFELPPVRFSVLETLEAIGSFPSFFCHPFAYLPQAVHDMDK